MGERLWWRDEAACRDAWRDPALHASFFGETVGEQRAAKTICASCPLAVRTACLEDGIHEPTGVRGGLGVRERQRLRSRRKIYAQNGLNPMKVRAV